MTRLEDLTILLTMVDRTRAASRSASNNITRVQRLVTGLAAAGKVAGAAISTALVAAVNHGEQLTTELAAMSRQLNLTFQESQAFFNSIRDADPTATIDQVNEAALTLAERFADARVEGGPLFALLGDFQGFELDLGVDNARDQLADFLEQVGQLPTASDRIFALKEVIGDEDAKPFFNTINNTERLNQLLVDLRTNVEDVDGVLSGFQVTAIERARESAGQLRKEWDDFAVNSFSLYAPALELINSILTKIVQAGNAVVGAVTNIQDRIRKLIGTYVQEESDIQVFDIERWEAHLKEIERLQAESEARRRAASGSSQGGGGSDPSDGPIVNEFGEFADLKTFESWYSGQQDAITQSMRRIVEIQDRDVAYHGVIPQEESAFLDGLDQQGGNAANDPFAFNVNSNGDGGPSQAEIERERMLAFAESVAQVGDALNASGAAFGAFARLAEANGSKSFKTFQRLQVAISTVAGISAQIQTLASVDNPTFFQKLAAYARMGAIVASGLAALKSVNVGSSGSSSGSASGGGVAAPASNAVGGLPQEVEQATPQRNVSISIQGNGNFTPEQVEELIQAINDNDSTTQIDSRRIAA